jgi:transposase
VRPEPRPAADEEALALGELVARRRQLVEMIVMETNRKCQVRDPGLRARIAELPELGSLGRRQIASRVGVAAFNRDSGQWRGLRTIAGGRATVRGAPYTATVVALRWNPVIGGHCNRLLEQHA